MYFYKLIDFLKVINISFMKKYAVCLFLFFAINSFAQEILSPSKKISLSFSITSEGKPTYKVSYSNKEIVQESVLGVALKDQEALDHGFVLVQQESKSVNETWQPVLGEQSIIQNNYNQVIYFLLQKATNRKFNIIFRVYNEGVAFRYEFPKQDQLNYFVISDEKTTFNLVENYKSFWIPGDYDSQEYAYNETKLSEIDNSKLDLNNGIGLKSIASPFRVQSPLMLKSPSGVYINIFEAAVVNYPVMHLDVDVNKFDLKANLVPNPIGDKAYLQTPCVAPWRTIMISNDARDIVSSKMILNLNEPSKIADTSWIKPMKYVGIWWEMHIGKATWDYAGSQNAQNAADGALLPSGKHGATTENTKRYIDFAAKH
jgi:hypothetical protein